MVVRHACASWGHWDTQCWRLPATAFQQITSDRDHGHLLLQDYATPHKTVSTMDFRQTNGKMIGNNLPALFPT